MLRLGLGLCLGSLALALGACGGDTSDSLADAGKSPDAGASKSADAGAGKSPDGGALKRGDGGVALPTAPGLNSVTAQVAGRTGKDLLITISADDPNHNAVGLWVRLLDAQGQPVLGFDSDRDGVADSAAGPLALENLSFDGDALTATATLRGLLDRTQQVTQVGVVAEGATNLRSDETIASVTAQLMVTQGQACDPLSLANRCGTGLGCQGQPTTCQPGVAPQITQMAFLTSANGPSILIQGNDPEGDLSTITFGFQNAQGQPTSIDSDGDGVPDLASFDYDATGASTDGTFFIRMQPADGLDQQVAKLTAIAVDLAGPRGSLQATAPATPPVRSAGAACDPRGFDVCAAKQVCSPGLVGATNKCQADATVRSAHCSAAPVIVPTATGATALGVAAGVSLFDTPLGCQSNDPKGRPEGLVTVRLTAPTTKLTLTTDRPGTNFDTALYLLPGCPVDSSAALGCNDDGSATTSASTLVVENLAAGDYLVVIDSFSYDGGCFELLATVD